MKKIKLLSGHLVNINNLISDIPNQLRRETILNLSNIHDKIIKGGFVELPDRLQIKMQKFKANQELQTTKQNAFGKNNIFQPLIIIYYFQNESNVYH